MKAPMDVVVRIACAVERRGGDMSDVEDLIAEWIRVHRYPQAHANDAAPYINRLYADERGASR